jgi:hypothetical protein
VAKVRESHTGRFLAKMLEIEAPKPKTAARKPKAVKAVTAVKAAKAVKAQPKPAPRTTAAKAKATARAGRR